MTGLVHGFDLVNHDAPLQRLKRVGLPVGLLVLTGGAQAALVAYQANRVDLVFDDDYTPVGGEAPA